MNVADSIRLFRGEQRLEQLDPLDRGLAYGDGVFETLRAHRGELPWWSAHWARLSEGAARLQLPLPNPDFVHHHALKLLEGSSQAVLKLVLTRGVGGRGYAPPSSIEPTVILSRHALPESPARGLNLRWCDLQLAHQPRLAGIKHCNRLEQVLARAEWQDADIDEGLLCDHEGQVICATSANVFALHEGRWHTPIIDRCGVAGILRQWLIDNEPGIVQSRLSRQQIEQTDALFLGNAVRGILPVQRLGDRHWSPSPVLEQLRQRLSAAAPMFAFERKE